MHSGSWVCLVCLLPVLTDFKNLLGFAKQDGLPAQLYLSSLFFNTGNVRCELPVSKADEFGTEPTQRVGKIHDQDTCQPILFQNWVTQHLILALQPLLEKRVLGRAQLPLWPWHAMGSSTLCHA